MSFRPFVLAPAAEIAADMVHPVLGVSIGALWHHLQHADDVVVISGGIAEDRHKLIDELRSAFAQNSFMSSSKFPALSQELYPRLRIRRSTDPGEPLKANRIRSAIRQGIFVSALPKLQIFFDLPIDGLEQRVTSAGSRHDRELLDRLRRQPDVPNAMARLFTGIPTLALDPRDDPKRQLTEAAAALEAVWPDLCRTAP
jgi:hypothetical protein